MNRRGFMGAILATACAPAIVRVDSLMRIVSHDVTVIFPPTWPSGVVYPPEVIPYATLVAKQRQLWAAEIYTQIERESFASRFLRTST